jgi:nicotinamide phosphoribosyltransferase
LIKENGQFKTVARDTVDAKANQLVTIFKNGQILTEYTLDQVRQLAISMNTA